MSCIHLLKNVCYLTGLSTRFIYTFYIVEADNFAKLLLFNTNSVVPKKVTLKLCTVKRYTPCSLPTSQNNTYTYIQKTNHSI